MAKEKLARQVTVEEHVPKTRFSRRHVLKAAVVGCAGVGLSQLFAACASPSAAVPTPTPPVTKPPEPTARPAISATPVAELEGIVAPKAARGELQEQTIVLPYMSGPEADAHKRLAPKWQEYTKGRCKVVVEDLGRGSVADEKWMTTLSAKSDAWDVLWVRSVNLTLAAEAGFLAPLRQFRSNSDLFNAEAYDLDDYPETVQDMVSYKGEPYIHPQEITLKLLCYRKDLLDKYGIAHPPVEGWTWEKLREVCLDLKAKLKADGQPEDMFPLVMQAKGWGQDAAYVMWGNQVEWFDDQSLTPKLYQPDAVAAIRFVTDMLWKDEVLSPGIVQYGYNETSTALQQGKAVMAIQADAAAPTFNDPKASPEIAGKIGYAQLPCFARRDPGFKSGWSMAHSLGVSAFSKKQEAAFEYATWFTSKEIARDCVVNGGGTFGRTSVLTDLEVQKAAGGQVAPMLLHFDNMHPG
ncbi:MAG: ABC transporter substrate-binding protein, partial [Chloroflexota bacterium]